MCELKSNLSLKSNVILKSDSHKIGAFIPFDLKPKEFKTTAAAVYLTAQQKKEQIKELFYAENFVEAEDRYSALPENMEMCARCPYKDICV